MSWRSWVIYRPSKPPTYRNLRRWVHLTLIAMFGPTNLFFSQFILPEVLKGMRNLDKMGFQEFFRGTTPVELFLFIILAAALLTYAIISFVIVLASIDALKDRLLDSGSAKPD